ncbi:hypothetical protein Aduo_005641 [Ancylostoma duodenale]
MAISKWRWLSRTHRVTQERTRAGWVWIGFSDDFGCPDESIAILDLKQVQQGRAKFVRHDDERRQPLRSAKEAELRRSSAYDDFAITTESIKTGKV